MPAFELLRQWAENGTTPSRFWEKPNSQYHTVLKNAFKNYMTWWERQNSKPESIEPDHSIKLMDSQQHTDPKYFNLHKPYTHNRPKITNVRRAYEIREWCRQINVYKKQQTGLYDELNVRHGKINQLRKEPIETVDKEKIDALGMEAYTLKKQAEFIEKEMASLKVNIRTHIDSIDVTDICQWLQHDEELSDASAKN